LAIWYDYDLSNYLNDGLKIINRLWGESKRIENLLIQDTYLAEIQTVEVSGPNFENITILEVITYIH
jgi:hypothetical protein